MKWIGATLLVLALTACGSTDRDEMNMDDRWSKCASLGGDFAVTDGYDDEWKCDLQPTATVTVTE
jgi:hypothetical protein